MNLNLLKTYVTVVEQGNFSRAAACLHLSQPAVSMQMQSLALELGVELLRRRGHRVEPTEAGSLLYRQAREVLRVWQQTVQGLDGLRQTLAGRLELGASTVPADFILPPLLCDFYRRHPEVTVRLTVGPSQQIVDALAAGKLDLAVVGLRPAVAGLNSRRIVDDQLVAVFAPDHPLARKRAINARELMSQPLLRRTSGSATRAVLEQALAGAGLADVPLQVKMELGSSRALLEAAARGLGVAVVSRLAADDYIAGGRLAWRPLADLELARSFWLVLPRTDLPRAAAAFADFLERSDL